MAQNKKEYDISLEINKSDDSDVKTIHEEALDRTGNKIKPKEYNLKTIPKCLKVNDGKDCTVWCVTGERDDEKVYTYEEAIDLTGNGFYIYTLLTVLAIAFGGMALDMFGLSVVVTSACDLKLTHAQETIVLSVPFLGCVVMSYPWGYIADTQGRLKSLRITLWGSFILASISAFSPNWIVLAVLRFSSTSFSSGIHSLSLTLLGETCSSKLKGPSMIAMPTLIFCVFGMYSACAYFVLNFHFAFDIGFIVFTPWRLLIIVMALPLGISAFFSIFFYESPNFLLNAGDEETALYFLRKISEGNGIKINKYPVKRVVLSETTSLRRDVPLLQSLMDQIFPLLKPPLLYRCIQLFFITVVIYSINNGFYAWLPFVADRLNSDFGDSFTNDNLCEIISTYSELNNTNTCTGTVTEFTLRISLIQSVAYGVLNIIVSLLSSRKKTVLIMLLLTSIVCGFSIPLVSGMILSASLFFGFLVNSMCNSVIFSYYVDVFPTSYRAMATCLGVMVARSSALLGVNLVGTYLASHCAYSFYSWSALLICGLVAAIFLPPGKSKKIC